MLDAFAITFMQCNTCKMTAAPIGLIVRTKAEIPALASHLHKQSGLICGEPQLIVLYSSAVVSNSLFEKKPLLDSNLKNGDNGGHSIILGTSNNN
jgi:hypothetical protein